MIKGERGMSKEHLGELILLLSIFGLFAVNWAYWAGHAKGQSEMELKRLKEKAGEE